MNSTPSPAARYAAKMHERGVTEELIERLVHTFYGKVRMDPDLGPIFAEKISGDWDAHLKTMTDFWSSVVLMSGRFKGNPVLKHRLLTAVRPEHFDRWLELFQQTAEEVCPDQTSGYFTRPANQIAESLQRHMFGEADMTHGAASPDPH